MFPAGVFVGGAVPPLAALLTWRKCTATAAVTGAQQLLLAPTLPSVFRVFRVVFWIR
jgi:hypothetical protein